jgi:hypothetical protein
MADLRGFDANTVEPSTDFEPLPAGTYEALIIDSEMKTTRSGDGQFLELVFEVIAGPHKGRRLWARLNLTNANATAVAIARAELSAICRAVGVLAPKDSVELHNLPLLVKVGLKKRSDTQELQNVLRGYARRETAPQPPATGQRPTGNGTAPWKR